MKLLFGSNRWLSPVLSLVLTTATTMTTSSSWFLLHYGVEGSSECRKNTGYNCGAVFPVNGNTCDQKGCCCNGNDGDGLKMNSCGNADGYAYRGCKSCWGMHACMGTNNVYIGQGSCQGKEVCQKLRDSSIGDGSCTGDFACNVMVDSVIGAGSCTGKEACTFYWRNGIYDELKDVTIGSNSCNGKQACYACDAKSIVPDNACNVGLTDDFTDGDCNYCWGEDHSMWPKPSPSRSPSVLLGAPLIENDTLPMKKKKKMKTSKKNAASHTQK